MKLYIRLFVNKLKCRICLNSTRRILMLLLFSLSYMFISCEKRVFNEERVVKLPLDEMVLLSDNVYADSTFTVLLYYDTLSCTSCVFKDLYIWKNLLKEYDSIQICTIFNYPTLRIKELEMANKVENIDVPLFVDTMGIFCKYNTDNIDLSGGRAFLISEDKRYVLFEGDPLRRKKDERRLFSILGNILQKRRIQ